MFITTEKARAKEKKRDGVGVMKDKELKLSPLIPWVAGIVYCELIKRELNKRLIFECRFDTRLKTTMGSMDLFIMNR